MTFKKERTINMDIITMKSKFYNQYTYARNQINSIEDTIKLHELAMKTLLIEKSIIQLALDRMERLEMEDE